MDPIKVIPEKYHAGYKEIATMLPTQFNQLFKQLSNSKYYSDIRILSNNITVPKKINEIIFKVLDSIVSLYSVIDKYELKTLEVAESIAELSKSIKELKNKKYSTQRFISRLKKLLDNEKLYVAYKSSSIYLEHKNQYISAKILSDIRPIFTKPDLSPKVSIISNVLHVHYRKGENEEDHQDFFIALDSLDLQNLRKAVNRAEAKNDTLKVLIKKSGMTFLNPAEEN